NASDTEDDLVALGSLTVEVAIDGGAWQSAAYNGVSGFYEWSWDTTLLADGTHSIVAQATDSAPNTVGDGPVSVTVSNAAANQAPTDIQLSNSTAAEDLVIGSVIGLLSATDPDAEDTATFSEIADPDGKFDVVGDELRLAAALDFETSTSHSVTIQVMDGGGLPYQEAFIITVTNVNQAPTANAGADQNRPDSDSVDGEDVTLNGSLSTDPDGDSLTFTWKEGGSTIATGMNPAPVRLSDGPHTITLTVNDGEYGHSDDVIIAVAAPAGGGNSPPSAMDDNEALPNGRSITIDVLSNDTDPDVGDVLSVTSVGAPANGIVTLNADDTVTYKRDRTFRDGCDSFTYTIQDSQGAPSGATVWIAIGSGSCGGGGDSAPSASIASPTGGTVSGNVTIEVNASDTEDAAGTLNVEVSIDGGTWQSTTYNGISGLYEWVWDTTMATDASHTIDARATDSNPNVTNAGQVTVTVSNGGGGSDIMFVGDVAFTQKNYGPGGSNHDLTTVVTIRWDSNGNGVADGGDSPVGQATVTVLLCHQGGTCWDWIPLSTSGAGTAKFILKRAPMGNYDFTVNGVTHGTYLWEPSLDVPGNPSFYTVN
ncbi:MAG: Ig-like domain-containing protein, partial [Alphaproteobacteria bacterium]